MANDIEKALAYQVKKEIAQRYFRLRSLIEGDEKNLKDLLKRLNELFNGSIRESFFTLYSLFPDEDSLLRLRSVLGLSSLPFLEEFKSISQDQRALMARSINAQGWFKKSRFINKVVSAYQKLFSNWQDYDDLLQEVLDELAIVQEELDYFQRNYSLDEIMHFLRGLNVEDESLKGTLGGGTEVGQKSSMDSNLALKVDLDQLRASIPFEERLPDPHEIMPALKQLASMVYKKNKKFLSKLI